MKQLVIISGKGGTGKTSITACLAALAGSSVIADADVDAADLDLMLDATLVERGPFEGRDKAAINWRKCTHCDVCRLACRFGAISVDHAVDDTACEGCALCSRLCPEEAVSMRPTQAGWWYRSDTRFGPLLHARLGVAAENSGRLVSLVRQKAQELASATGARTVLIDGPPGTGCPVIASVTGCDLALVVTEPTPSGRHDLERALELLGHFQIPAHVVVNKFDLSPEVTGQIEAMIIQRKAFVAGRIPFDPDVAKAIDAGRPLVEFSQGPAAIAIRGIWDYVNAELEKL